MQEQPTNSEPIILAVDTSSKATGLALARGAMLLGSITTPVDQTRSEKLWAEIDTLLAEAGQTIRDVDLFSVCRGPGGFTGLRVGMAAVKGFAEAMNKPVAGVTSLEAAAISDESDRAYALVNAYKGEVYSQLFSFDHERMPVAENEPLVSSVEDALARVAGLDEVTFVGDAAETHVDAISGRGKLNWSVSRSDHCLAEDIARLAFLKYSRSQLDDAGTLKACYVRPSEAEIKLSLGLLGSKIKRSL
ncbi:MAG TPA: tRNA (adenosine(37)-N6)-threonylcarbamoyltransferase complex dimerization subunit type 1 TsaB, partial [Blastocatellia bacterium]|nr:tRNA (adenosine(37)-N6)-threonylcarbamoyltransferase complex dimerization subunit type 1 TsaB [Blastocatellia bacterium]